MSKNGGARLPGSLTIRPSIDYCYQSLLKPRRYVSRAIPTLLIRQRPTHLLRFSPPTARHYCNHFQICTSDSCQWSGHWLQSAQSNPCHHSTFCNQNEPHQLNYFLPTRCLHAIGPGAIALACQDDFPLELIPGNRSGDIICYATFVHLIQRTAGGCMPIL